MQKREGGWEGHTTNLKDVFAPHVCPGEEVGPLLIGDGWLPEMEGRSVL